MLKTYKNTVTHKQAGTGVGVTNMHVCGMKAERAKETDMARKCELHTARPASGIKTQGLLAMKQQ